MMTDQSEKGPAEMRTERIKMQDGRYLIYYTFPGLERSSETGDEKEPDVEHTENN